MENRQKEPKTTQSPSKDIQSGRTRVGTAVREPRMASAETEGTVQNGRLPRRRAELTVKRETVSDVVEHKGGAEIVRIRTGVDRVMLSLIVILLALGAIMIFSASYPEALAQKGDSMHYIKRHLGFLALGAGLLILASVMPIGFYKKMAPIAFGVALVLLIIVLIPGIGISNGEARRWLGIKGTSFTFQPSELMKIALVLILAWYLDKYRDLVTDRTDRKKTFLYGAFFPCALVGGACVLVLLEKHLSGTIIVGLIGLFVMFIGGVHLGWMSLIVGVGGAGAVAAFLAMNPYALERILTFTDENADKLDEAWQTTQGLLAIGSGGLLGVGLGASNQKHSYVSEAQNDFIFTIFCEEMGFVGAVVLIVLFLLFIWRGYVIAMHAPDTFSCLTVLGIISKVGIQAFLNIAVVTAVIPNTGIPLPFFSYGGTSLLILMGEMGIVLSVSKHSYLKK